MTTRAGMYMLSNCATLNSYNLPRVQDLRSALDKIESNFERFASLLFEPDNYEAIAIFQSDDIEGFFNNCKGTECVDDLRQVCGLFKAQYTRKNDQRGQCCYVSKFKTKPVLSGNTNAIKLDSSYSKISWDDMIAHIEWSITNSLFTLGKLLMSSDGGLFQGRAISVLLAIVNAVWSEHTHLQSSLQVPCLMGAVRYVDDKFAQAIATTTSESVHAAVTLMNQCNGHYRDTLKIGEEDPLADGLFIYIGHLLIRETPLHWGLMHFMKNIYCTVITGKFASSSQVYRTGRHCNSYQPRYMLRGQRFGRILSALRQSDENIVNLALYAKCLSTSSCSVIQPHSRNHIPTSSSYSLTCQASSYF